MRYSLHIFLAVLGFCLFSAPAYAGYKYVHAEGEYLVELPGPPMGETIWAHKVRVPYLDSPPKLGNAGEYVTFSRIDKDTGDSFDVRIFFIKAGRSFLRSLSKEDVKEFMAKELKHLRLENEKIGVSVGSDTLKWGTHSGYSVNKNNETLYNIVHFLVGQETITMVKVNYSIINPVYNQYYKNMANSIQFLGR